MLPPKTRQIARSLMLSAATLLIAIPIEAQRARDLGIPFEGTPGPLNAITDIAGVEVGHSTIIRGEGKRVEGQGPVRTGVTVIFPFGKDQPGAGAPAGYHVLNGTGEMTGMILAEEIGGFMGPLAITNTVSIGTVRDALLTWARKHVSDPEQRFALSIPVVAETWDGGLNDIWGMHVREEHVHEALASAASGPVAEGSVGGGTGMICYSLKCGIGTASRALSEEAGGWTVGVLVQANHGRLHQLLLGGIPIGQELGDAYRPKRNLHPDGDGSIIIIVATDAPLLPQQLKRVARRASLGLARTGSTSGDGSGDIFLAFSTARRLLTADDQGTWKALSFTEFDPLFEATVHATEEAIANALVAGRTMTGADGLTVQGLPHDETREILRRHARLVE